MDGAGGVAVPCAAMRRGVQRGWMATQWAVMVATCAAAAAAQDTHEALRAELVAQADRARDAGDHARAREYGLRAEQLRSSPSLTLFVAQEDEQLGRLVEGLERARRCAADATSDPTLRNRERIERNCRALADDLESRVARVTLNVPADHVALHVLVGDRTIPAAAWGVPIPVDPGTVDVRADDATGCRFATTVRITAGGAAAVGVTCSAPSPRPVVPVLPSAPQVDAAPMSPVIPDIGRPRAHSVAPWLLGGLGGASLVVAGVLWALHGSAIASRDAGCDAGGCDPSTVDDDARARSFTAGTNAMIGLGGAALAAGVVWLVIDRTTGSRPEPLRPSAMRVPGGLALTVGGAL